MAVTTYVEGGVVGVYADGGCRRALERGLRASDKPGRGHIAVRRQGTPCTGELCTHVGVFCDQLLEPTLNADLRVMHLMMASAGYKGLHPVALFDLSLGIPLVQDCPLPENQ